MRDTTAKERDDNVIDSDIEPLGPKDLHHPFSALLPTRSLVVPREVPNGCISTKSRDDLVVQQVRVLLLRCLRLRIPQIGSTCLSKGRTWGLLHLVLLFLHLQFSWILVFLTTPCTDAVPFLFCLSERPLPNTLPINTNTHRDLLPLPSRRESHL